MSEYRSHEDFIKRTEKLHEIRALGIDPYPAKYSPTSSAHSLADKYQGEVVGNSEEAAAGVTPLVSVAGRLVLFRAMGKNAFAHVQDGSGRIQVMFNRDATHVAHFTPTAELSPLKFIEKKLDLGDFIGVEGHLFRTQTGELTIFAKTVTVLCKTLLPLPDKHSGLVDKGMRYRKRWLDLVSHPDVVATFRCRSAILQQVRRFFEDQGFMEVETAVLQNQYGGAEAAPFLTKLNALDQEMYLRISLEISLKKLVIGGLERVFEIGKIFRNEGIDRTHNPEFTMLEAYAAYWDYRDVMVLAETLFESIALRLFGTTQITLERESGPVAIDLKAPWKRLSMKEAIRQYAHLDVDTLSEDAMREILGKKGSLDPQEIQAAPRGALIALLFEEFAEEHLIQPHHIIDHPIETTPLCKLHRDPHLRQERFVERFETFIGGFEFCNAYSELNDPELQRKLLEDQAAKRLAGDAEAHPLDEEFIEAICQGMPPTGGIGIGIDRLVMLFTHAASIRDVIYFPLMQSADHATPGKREFKIDPAIASAYPDVKLGILFAKGLTNKPTPPEIVSLFRATEQRLRETFTLDTLMAHPKIADWRAAYQKFGVKSSHRSSVEALFRRILQGKEIPSISAIVDIYNLVSLKHLLPAGGDDIDHIDEHIQLTFADGSERFVMLGTTEPEKIQKGEVIYRDKTEVLCRSWNYRECEKTKITLDTHNLCLAFEGLKHTSKDEILQALAECKQLLATHCGGTIDEHFLDCSHLSFAL